MAVYLNTICLKIKTSAQPISYKKSEQQIGTFRYPWYAVLFLIMPL